MMQAQMQHSLQRQQQQQQQTSTQERLQGSGQDETMEAAIVIEMEDGSENVSNTNRPARLSWLGKQSLTCTPWVISHDVAIASSCQTPASKTGHVCLSTD
mmetsp:Transcript_12090/g.26390  ORF Transcript_12090/g.26390 Transcript_12090/m.26390 type:complete len:100 (+) Transcript_12090:582-881(+)